jgi:hypothetical protein
MVTGRWVVRIPVLLFKTEKYIENTAPEPISAVTQIIPRESAELTALA